MSNIQLKTLTGSALEQHIDELARLRIQVFRDFPYLYDGGMAYERQYLQTYLQCADAAIIVAFDGTEVIGASSCLPLRDEEEAFKRVFRNSRYDVDKLFYCAESVLDTRYRGQGLGVAFFQLREAHAAKLGGFSHACFCAVDRPADHPLRPQDYLPVDRFWEKRGYQRLSHLQARFNWKDIDQSTTTEKTLTFWIKALESNHG